MLSAAPRCVSTVPARSLKLRPAHARPRAAPAPAPPGPPPTTHPKRTPGRARTRARRAGGGGGGGARQLSEVLALPPPPPARAPSPASRLCALSSPASAPHAFSPGGGDGAQFGVSDLRFVVYTQSYHRGTLTKSLHARALASEVELKRNRRALSLSLSRARTRACDRERWPGKQVEEAEGGGWGCPRSHTPVSTPARLCYLSAQAMRLSPSRRVLLCNDAEIRLGVRGGVTTSHAHRHARVRALPMAPRAGTCAACASARRDAARAQQRWRARVRRSRTQAPCTEPARLRCPARALGAAQITRVRSCWRQHARAAIWREAPLERLSGSCSPGRREAKARRTRVAPRVSPQR